MALAKPLLELELRPVQAPAGDGTRVFVLLPSLEELVGFPGFGRKDAICLPECPRPFDPWALFSPFRDRQVLH